MHLSRPGVPPCVSAALVIIPLARVELFSNLSWVAVAIALWGVWLARQRAVRGASVLPGIAAQLAALVVLTAVLLPVISITDDLQASHNPAEVARTASAIERHLSPGAASRTLPVALALLAFCANSWRPRCFALLALHRRVPQPMQHRVCGMWSRPPPAV